MKKRIWIILAVGMCFVPVLIGGIAFSQEDIAVVGDSGFEKVVRPPVPFMHDEHNEKAGLEECGVCHHISNDNAMLNEADTL